MPRRIARNFNRSYLYIALYSLISASAVFDAEARAQGTIADYDRADRLAETVRGKVYRDRVIPHWFAGNDRFWYRVDLAGGVKEFLVVDAIKKERSPAFDHFALARTLAKESGKPVDPEKLPFDRIVCDDDGSIRFEFDGKAWRYDRTKNTIAIGDKLPAADPSSEPPAESGRGRGREPRGLREQPDSPRGADSPDGAWTVKIQDNNVLLIDKKTKAETRLSSEGTDSDAYESGVYWFPDSSRFVAIRTAKGDDRKVHLVQSSPADRLQPKLLSYDYLKPGDRVPISKPHFFEIATKKEIPIADTLFSNPYEINHIRIRKDGGEFTFVYNARGHQVLRLVGVDARTGATRAVIDETSKTFIDYAHKQFSYYLDDTNEIIWMSERDGWNHLYLIDRTTGYVKNQITRGEWIVRGIDKIDEARREIRFRAGGLAPGQDPYYIHYCRIAFDGSGLVDLTPGDGTHEITYSPDRRHYLDRYSRVDLPPVVELRRTEDGALLLEVERADWSALLAMSWRVPERFVSKGRDGIVDIYGVIIRPTNFDPSHKYPVIEQIYAGPQGSFVPKRFAPYLPMQSLAELGFIVVQIDGMGTSNRSKAFHDVCCKNLADAGFPDRILWLKAAAAKYPYLDLTRVGIYGGSAGGQNALGALLWHGDFYKVAASDCGCHDNRMDKIWWNELWMGWPIGPHYAEQSNVVNAHKLTGKLLLTVGELDHNVDPASTMQVVNALIKADKDFDLLVIPGVDHGGGGKYAERRRRDFFVRHLLGVEPRCR